MATAAQAPGVSDAAPSQTGSARLNPTILFWVAGLVIYGAAAANAAHGHFLDETSRDIWQHLAALRALISDPVHPLNPFVPTHDVSRHFHPYWVAVAYLARAVGWNEWQALGFASFLSAGVMLVGIYSFGRAFYRDPWGPVALLAAMVFGWVIPVSHTGYHSIGTLLEGFAYPAALLIGLSLILWALVIRAFEQPRLGLAIAPLAALMFATHQLGAGIGFITAGCLILLWPGADLKRRAVPAIAIAVGIVASTAWPYFNPLDAVLRTGNASWPGGVPFYTPLYLLGAFVPQIMGLVGLRNPDFRDVGRPILLAFFVFAALFPLGLAGVLIATRFLMPAVLMLHIGLGALLISIARRWQQYAPGRQLTLFAQGCTVVMLFLGLTWIYLTGEARDAREDGSDYSYALALTRDIPDLEPVAVYDVAVWPVVATGQRAISEPWPEPEIADLATRQAATERLFDSALSRSQRLALAKHWGVRVLIMHEHGAMRRATSPHLIETLERQSVRHERAGKFLRFDLY